MDLTEQPLDAVLQPGPEWQEADQATPEAEPPLPLSPFGIGSDVEELLPEMLAGSTPLVIPTVDPETVVSPDLSAWVSGSESGGISSPPSPNLVSPTLHDSAMSSSIFSPVQPTDSPQASSESGSASPLPPLPPLSEQAAAGLQPQPGRGGSRADAQQRRQQSRRGSLPRTPPRTYRWEQVPVSQAPATRGRHTVGIDEQRGVMLVFGGQNYDLRRKYSNIARFDLVNGRWVTTDEEFADGPCARSSHASVSTEDSLYVFGGATGISFLSSPGCCRDASTWRFNHRTSEWSRVEIDGLDLVSARYGHTTVLAPGDKVYLFGGMTDSGCDSSTYEIDLKAGKVRRLNCSFLGTLGDLCGPVECDPPQPPPQPPTAQPAPGPPQAQPAPPPAPTPPAPVPPAPVPPAPVPPAPVPPASPASQAPAATLGPTASAGVDAADDPGAGPVQTAVASAAAAVSAIAELVDASSATHALALAQEAVASIGATAAQEVLVELLEDVVDIFARDVHGAAPSYRPRVTARQVRERVRGFGHTAVYNRHTHSMYVLGGTVDGRHYHSSFLRLDLATQTWQIEQSVNTPPQGRYVHCAAIDDRRNAMYVFGGYCGTYTNDVHEYLFETKRWRQIRADSNSPTPSLRSGACSAIWRDHLYVFGGCDDHKYYSDVWRLRLWNDTMSLKDAVLEHVAWNTATGSLPAPEDGEVPAGLADDVRTRADYYSTVVARRLGGACAEDARN